MKQRKKSFGMRISAFVLSFAMVCTLLAGVNVVAFAADGDATTVDVQKFYYDVDKGGNGEHIYTIDESEISYYKGEAAWNDEGTAWTAPVSSNSPVYRVCNYNTGEHLWITDKGYVDYLVGLGWTQEQGIAFYSDDNKGTPVYRLWDGTDRVGSHHFSTNVEEISWLESLGWKNEGPQFYGVKEESSEVQLVPNSGYQSDGTVINTDTLSLVFGADFGVPSSIVWYKDGAVVGVFNSMNLTGGLTSDFLQDDVELTIPTGRYSVTVENTKGETFTTNTVTVVDKKVLAVLSDYTITEDYTLTEVAPGVKMAQNIVYAPESNKLVVTVKMNRNDYTGTLGLIPAEAVMSGEATVDDLVANAPVQDGTFVNAIKEKDFTDANAIATFDADEGMGIYLDDSDGCRTYKWVVNMLYSETVAPVPETLTRGESYVLGFAQDDVSDPEDLDTFAIAGIYSAPYVNAPIGIQLASVEVDEDTNTAAFTIGIAEMGPLGPQKAEWLGTGEAIGGTLAIYGSEDITISEEDYDDMDEDPAWALNGGTIAPLVMDPDNDDYYFMAILTLDEGIYGPEALTFTSEVVEPAEEAAEGLTAWYLNPLDMDNFNPANITATVSSSFRAAGTLELYRNTSGVEWSDTNPVDLDDATKVADVKVSKGVSSATFKNAVTKLYDGEGANQYAVKFVPNDTTEYKETITAYPKTAEVSELPARFEFAEKDIDADTGAAVKAYNQFGKEITEDIEGLGALFLPTAETMKIVEVTAGSDIVPTVTITPEKEIAITVIDGTKAVVGDSYKLTLDNGQTVYVTVKAIQPDGPGSKFGEPTKWTVSIQ